MSLYLIADGEAESIRALEEKGAQIEAASLAKSARSGEQMSMKNGVATIHIRGILQPHRIPALDFFGKPQTAYSDIVAQVEDAEASGASEIVFLADSPGGNIRGMFDAMDAIRTTPIKTTGRISGEAQSAAYMLISQTDTIEANSESDLVGSLGVKTSISDVKEVSNTDSPNKVSGAKDDDGNYAAQSTLNEVYGMVLPRMADARNTTAEKINSDWGKGGTMTARTALSRGMIDMIREPKPAGRSGSTKGKNMDINQLRAEHPDLYASAFEAGKEAGIAEFKELASAHSALAEMSGDTTRALTDIAAGNGITPTCQVHHTTTATKKAMLDARTEENAADVGEGGDAQATAASSDTYDEKHMVDEYAAAGLEVAL